MLNIVLAIAASIYLSVGVAHASHCKAQYGKLVDQMTASEQAAKEAAKRNDTKKACTAARDTLAKLIESNKLVRPDCLHGHSGEPIQTKGTRVWVAKLCASTQKDTAKIDAKPTPPKRPASPPTSREAISHVCTGKEKDPASYDPVEQHCALAALFKKAADSTRNIGEKEAAIGAYMQAAHAYGLAGDSKKQATMLDAASALAKKDAAPAEQKK